MQKPDGDPRVPWHRRFLRLHVDSEQATHGIYGTIVVLAIIVALETHPPSGRAIMASVLGGVVAVVLAEAYAKYVGLMLRRHHRPTADEWRHIVFNTLGSLVATAPPILLLALGVAGVMALDTAFVAAKWSGAAVIAGYAYVANRVCGFTVVRSVVASVAFGFVAFGLVIFKQYFH